MIINRNYAEQHGYKFVAFPTNRTFCPHEASEGLVACKLKCLEHVMRTAPNDDIVMVVDSDAAFNDHTISIEQFLTTHKVTLTSVGTWVVFPADCEQYYLNAGVQIWKNTAATRAFLRDWYDGGRKIALHPAEQGLLKDWILQKKTVGGVRIADHVERIPYGSQNWHIGSCKHGSYIPAKWLTHVTGRFAEERHPIFDSLLELEGVQLARDVHTFHSSVTILGGGTLSSDVFTNAHVVGKERLGLCVAASVNHFDVVVYASNDNSNWITLSTYYGLANGVHQALTNAFKYYKITINNSDLTTSVVINVADLSH